MAKRGRKPKQLPAVVAVMSPPRPISDDSIIVDETTAPVVLRDLAKTHEQYKAADQRVKDLQADLKRAKEARAGVLDDLLRELYLQTHASDLPLYAPESQAADRAEMIAVGASQPVGEPR